MAKILRPYSRVKIAVKNHSARDSSLPWLKLNSWMLSMMTTVELARMQHSKPISNLRPAGVLDWKMTSYKWRRRVAIRSCMENYYTDMEFAVATLADFIRIVGQNH